MDIVRIAGCLQIMGFAVIAKKNCISANFKESIWMNAQESLQRGRTNSRIF